MKKGGFKIDCLFPHVFTGLTMGETWNGWECPFFDFEEASKIVTAQNDLTENSAYYNETNDTFIFNFIDDDSEEYSGEMLNGKNLYAIGSGNWIWEETNDK